MFDGVGELVRKNDVAKEDLFDGDAASLEAVCELGLDLSGGFGAFGGVDVFGGVEGDDFSDGRADLGTDDGFVIRESNVAIDFGGLVLVEAVENGDVEVDGEAF